MFDYRTNFIALDFYFDRSTKNISHKRIPQYDHTDKSQEGGEGHVNTDQIETVSWADIDFFLSILPFLIDTFT